MEGSKARKTTMYLFVLVCVFACGISGDAAAESGFEEDVDINSLLNHDFLPKLESFLLRHVTNILKTNPGLLKYVALSDPAQAENQQLRNKRLAGLENLDFMTGVFSRLPMRTNAAMSDLQQRMREVGRRK